MFFHGVPPPSFQSAYLLYSIYVRHLKQRCPFSLDLTHRFAYGDKVLDGFLYVPGHPEDRGSHHPNVTGQAFFVYPDFETAIEGTWLSGKLVVGFVSRVAEIR